MALYDVPIHDGFKILTHTSNRRFDKNGFAQVGNTIIPTNPINPSAVMRSSIYNKNLSLRGISEAGYGRRYPNYHLSYAGAGSPRNSLRYAGAGSPRASLRYVGAGSPKTSLRDAYINDNPPPGTLGKIGLPGRGNSIRGLADDPTITDTPVDTGSTEGPTAPTADTSGGFFSTIGNAFSTLFSTTAVTATQAGTLAANKAVANAITGTPSTQQQIVTSLKTATNPKSILGISVDTLMILGLLGGAYYVMKR